jgi:hypothetical protein
LIRSILISKLSGTPILNWSFNNENLLKTKQILLSGSIISAIEVYAKEIFYSKVQKIEMDSGILYLRGDSLDEINAENPLETNNFLIISAFVDKNDNHLLVEDLLTKILAKVKNSLILSEKFELNRDLNEWITNLLIKNSKFRDNKLIFYSFILILISFFISTLFIGLNYGFWIDKEYEESLQTIIGLFIGIILVTLSAYLAGDKKQARIASILSIPFGYLIGDFLIVKILISPYWEQSLGNPFIFLGYLIFVSLIGSQLGGNFAERQYLYQ